MENNANETQTNPNAEGVVDDGGLMVSVTDSFGQTGSSDDENAENGDGNN
ncbi:MAG: hypothetical protein AAGN35_09490 [Bacteroidota bacterium]